MGEKDFNSFLLLILIRENWKTRRLIFVTFSGLENSVTKRSVTKMSGDSIEIIDY